MRSLIPSTLGLCLGFLAGVAVFGAGEGIHAVGGNPFMAASIAEPVQ